MKSKPKSVAKPTLTTKELRSQISRARVEVEQTVQAARAAKAGSKLARKTSKQAKKAAKAARKHYKALTQKLEKLARLRTKAPPDRKPAKTVATVGKTPGDSAR